MAGIAGRPRDRPATGRSTSMRLEKGYRVWGSDITPETTPDEAGLSFAVRVEQGRSSAATPCSPPAGRRPTATSGRLRCLTMLDDPRAVCLGSEPVRVDGRRVRPGHLGRLRLPGGGVDRVRLPSVHCGQLAPRSRSVVFGAWHRRAGPRRAALRPHQRAREGRDRQFTRSGVCTVPVFAAPAELLDVRLPAAYVPTRSSGSGELKMLVVTTEEHPGLRSERGDR